MMMKKRLQSRQEFKMNDNKRVLIIDALNMYLRAYIVDPSLSRYGQKLQIWS